MSIRLSNEQLFVAHAYRARIEATASEQKRDACLIIGLEVGCLSATSGFITPADAREIAKHLIERAEWCEAAAI